METQKILIIEDNKLNLKLIRTLLLISNFKVYEAENAEIGFQILEDQRPDIILMDIQLPGMDGLTATRRIKSTNAYKDIPVIALTAKAMEGDEEKALAAGCDGYIAKPINALGFISTLNDYLKNANQNTIEHNDNTPKDFQETEAIASRIKNIDEVFSQRRKILIVDDERLIVQMLQHRLSQYAYDTIAAYNGEDALDIVEKELPDLILLDIMMPGIDGFEVTRRIRSNKKTSDIPIILVSVLNTKEDRIRGLNLGADDFLNKPIIFEELLARVRSLIRLKAYQEQIKGYQTIRESFFSTQDNNQLSPKTEGPNKSGSRFEHALHTAMTDSLTTLYTKDYLLNCLEKELNRVKRHKTPLSLMMIDIDDFKAFNKKHGRVVGDIILKDIGILLTKSIREVDIAARYDGEEFAIILPYTDDTGAAIVGERLRSIIASHAFNSSGDETSYFITVSIGVVTCQNNPLDKTSMVKIAKELMVSSWKAGKNQVGFRNVDAQ
ncbi:MAG: Two-component response regulator modulated diguanylate cyclase [Candidatus Magnetoglobus multicellularis str. Araruama]|uniref:Two-component response regulator modulated diguanylate cyclase n=1 Tax=Candidatus Magnetoglobus multicellularis str. Araruama TaxID=890399 RepID=A0A1V1PB85_9BACT|nr:MAG: Two-component response regulator modulated diguanylate cyclase [Candidatus Magnetoglobus multicellularis str. Araruama]